MSKGLDALKQIGEYHIGEKKYGYDIKETRIYGIVEQELKEHEKLKNLVAKMFGENGLDLEKWAHLDKPNTYHIVYTNSYEHLDIPISKEDYDFLGGLYGKDRVRD